jgi:hypothetical protein
VLLRYSMALVAVVLAAGAVLSSPLAPWPGAMAGAGTALHETCTARQVVIRGSNYEVFCGPAKATVTIGRTRLVFAGGQCQRAAEYFAVNIGAAPLGDVSRPARPYFGVAIGRIPGRSLIGGRPAAGDGTYSRVPLAFDDNGEKYLLMDAAVTLKDDRRVESFAGTLLSGGKARGSFSC